LKPPFSIQAGIYIPTATEDPFVCPRDKAMAAAKKVSTAERLQTWWNKIKGDPLVQIRNNFPFLDNIEELNGGQSSSSLTTTTTTNELDGDAIAKKMVMAQRGNCLFEEKAIMIQKHHAAVLVVVNKEVKERHSRSEYFFFVHIFCWCNFCFLFHRIRCL